MQLEYNIYVANTQFDYYNTYVVTYVVTYVELKHTE